MDIDDYLNLQSHSDGSTFDIQDIVLANQDNTNNNSNHDASSAPPENSTTAATTPSTELIPHDSMNTSYPLSSMNTNPACWNDDMELVPAENDNSNRLFDKTPLPQDVEQFLYTFGAHPNLLSTNPNWALLAQAAHDQDLSSLSHNHLSDPTTRTVTGPSCLPDFLAPQYLTLTATASTTPTASLMTDTPIETSSNDELVHLQPATTIVEPSNTERQGMVTRAKRKKSIDTGTTIPATTQMDTRSSKQKQVTATTTDGSPLPKKKRAKKLYCICQQPYDGQPMVQCDGCKQWFHCNCVNLDADEVENVDWICDMCKTDADLMDASTQPNLDEPIEQETTPDKNKPITRQARRRHTCLLATCNNYTRADSYCSDKCARSDSNGTDVVSSRSIIKKRAKPNATNINTTLLETESPAGDTTLLEKDSPKSEDTDEYVEITDTSVDEPQVTNPSMADPIRKNVIKSLTTTLTPILTRVTDELPEALAIQVANDPLEAAELLATDIEGALYDHLGDDDDDSKYDKKLCGTRYKVKVRSLLYNLRDKANNEFQRHVVRGDFSAEALALMSSEDMANPELKSMSESLREKSIKNSVLKIETMPIIKKTHKGDIIMMPKKDNTSNNESFSQPTSLPKLTTIATSKDDSNYKYTNSNKMHSPTTPTSTSSPSSASASTVSATPPVMTKDSMDALWKQIGITRNTEGTQKLNEAEASRRKKSSVDLEALLGDENEDIDLYAGDDDDKDLTSWSGRVNMPDVASFDAIARQIGGRELTMQEWQDILPAEMFVEGRIKMDSANKYVSSMEQSSSREIVLLEVECQSSTAANKRHLQTLLNYFESRKRYGVVSHDKTKIKDFYLWPLYKSDPMPHALRAVQVKEKQREVDLLLGVLVMAKSKPGRTVPSPPQSRHHHQHRHTPLPNLQQQQGTYQPQHFEQSPPSLLYQQPQRYQSQQKQSTFPQLGNNDHINSNSQSPYDPSYPTYYPS